MDKLIVRGRCRLEGSVETGGAKNSVLPIMAASLLCEEDSPCLITSVPSLRDVEVMGKALEVLGARVKLQQGCISIDAGSVSGWEVGNDLARLLRASNLVMGPLLGRFRQFRVAKPGGCDIGSRPLDLHIKGFQLLGAEVNFEHGYVEARADKLKGADIHLDFPSVGATENIMMAAATAEGVTIIRNAAREPEIVDLQNFLNRMGARIRGAGLDVIRIEGVKKLHACDYYGIIPDRIEAGTHMVAGAITGGDVLVKNVIPEHVEAITAKLKEMGVEVTVFPDAVRVKSTGKLKGTDFRTLPYPGFPTDMQPQVMALACIAEGTSVITETIFDNRFRHVDELRCLGANIRIHGRTAVVRGTRGLSGSRVRAHDLRAAAALVLAGFAADGETTIEGVSHLDRGYERLEEKYRAIGADMYRV